MTQLKVLVSNPANDWDFPLKVFGIAVVFAGLMYMLFAHSDVVRENIVLGVNKVRRYFGKEDIVYNKKSDEDEHVEIYDPSENVDAASTAATKGGDTEDGNGSGEYSVDKVKQYVEKATSFGDDDMPKAGYAMRSGHEKKKEPTGYCLVGEDMGLRTCIPVNEADECMSGDIFTTEYN